MKKHPALWTRNFTLVTVASALGSAGAIAGGFALSFLVFDETGSTLASALIIAIQLLPYTFIPLFVAPIMDRLPRKAFLVAGDLVNGLIYLGMGLWLTYLPFSYTGYLAISVLLACLGAVDRLAYTSIYPDLIPPGEEQKGYAVSSMLYPMMTVIVGPLAAVLLDILGIPLLLMIQGGLSLSAALLESFITISKPCGRNTQSSAISLWFEDIREAFRYLKKEQGLLGIFSYMAVTNGISEGFSPGLVAFFRTAPGFSAAMYALTYFAEFLGRSFGSIVQYKIKIPKEKRFGFVFLVYQIYAVMDMILLWLPYPLMLANRGLCGFFGNNSAIVRNAAVQKYIPSHLRARINAFNDTLATAAASILALLVGFLGEIVDYNWCITICGAVSLLTCWLLIGGNQKDIRLVYEAETENISEQSPISH